MKKRAPRRKTQQAPALPRASRWISAIIRIASSHPDIEHVLDTVGRLSERPMRTNFLLLGEPGTGKEGLGRAIHELVGGGGPLLKARILGLDAARQAQELAKPLATARAMILLDELCALDFGVQRDVLDAIKRPDGPRLIAMSDEDPHAAVTAGRLRHDLYYRVARIVLTLPPLRERPEDIPAAAVWMGNRVLRDQGQKAEMRLPDDTIIGTGDVQLTHGAVEVLQQHDWEGNFRELEAVLERALMLYREGGPLTAEAVRQALHARPASRARTQLS